MSDCIKTMFRNFQSGGYSLEGSNLGSDILTKLIIVIAIAYTSATLQGREIKKMGIQKYVVRPETKSKYGRRHSAFYVGQHQYHWLCLGQICEKIVAVRPRSGFPTMGMRTKRDEMHAN